MVYGAKSLCLVHRYLKSATVLGDRYVVCGSDHT